jgi:hypothetical protein
MTHGFQNLVLGAAFLRSPLLNRIPTTEAVLQNPIEEDGEGAVVERYLEVAGRVTVLFGLILVPREALASVHGC